ncbi:MAG: DUF4157 domain-containing protein [Rubrivivax sp.]|nr:DUF4157 domain-containing protein [Rubrivivax sp.]
MKAALPAARVAALEHAADQAVRQPQRASAQPRIAPGELRLPAAAAPAGGSPLPSPLREAMQSRFGHDFTRVRVHAGADGQAMARARRANAVTQGHHVAFAAGRWAPETARGQALLMHELAHVVQQSELATGVPQCQSADAPNETVEYAAAEGDLAGAADTPERQALVDAMNAFMNATVGEKVFDAAMRERTWDDHKAEEAMREVFRQVDIALETVATGKLAKRPKVPITTTCIHVQAAMLRRVESLHAVLGPNQFALGPAAKMIGSTLGPGVWNEAAPNMARRPRKGDIYVLEFTDSKVRQLMQFLAGGVNEDAALDERVAKRQQQLEDIRQRQREHAEGTAAPGSPKPKAHEESFKQAEIDRIRKQQAELKQRIAAVGEQLGPARERADVTRQARMDAIAEKNARSKKPLPDFEFSHVGYVVSIERLPDTDPRAGAGRKRELWTTFDGGQKFAKGGRQREGATLVRRHYSPETNEITGEAQQVMGPRILKGWVDIDKLAAAPRRPKAGAAK